MITLLFFELAITVATGVVSLFPTYELPSSVASAGSSFGAQLAAVDGVFPIATLGICLGILLAVYLLAATMRFAVFVYELIPFKAT